MKMAAERYIDAPRERVWAALNDVEVLKRSIIGCKKLEWHDDDVINAEVRARIGPIDTTFKGRLMLSERDAPNSYRLTGEGQGVAAGFASGSATVRLLPEGEGTRLQYEVDATVGGKLAQIGSRLVDAAALKFAESFFERLGGQLAPVPTAVEATVAPSAAGSAAPLAAEPRRAGLKPLYWVPMLIAVVFFILYVVALA